MVTSPDSAWSVSLKFVRQRALLLVGDGEINWALVAYSIEGFVKEFSITASCCGDGSLAVIQLVGFQEASEVSLMLEGVARICASSDSSNHAGSCLGRDRSTVHHPQASSHGGFVFISVATYVRSSDLVALRKKDIVLPLSPMLYCWSIVIAASETGVSTSTPTGVRDGSVLMDQRWLQWVNKVLLQPQNWESGASNLELRLSRHGKSVQESNRFVGAQRHDYMLDTSQWRQHRPSAWVLYPARRAFSSVTRYDKSVASLVEITGAQAYGGQIPDVCFGRKWRNFKHGESPCSA